MDDNTMSSPDADTEPELPVMTPVKRVRAARSPAQLRIMWLLMTLVALILLSFLATALVLNSALLRHSQVTQRGPTPQVAMPTSQPTSLAIATATPTATVTMPQPTVRPTVLPTATLIPDDPYGFTYFLGANGHIYGRGQSGKLYNLGGTMVTAPQTIIYQAQLFVFAKGTDGALRYRMWDGKWSTWNWLGGTIKDAHVSIIQFSGQLYIFMLSSTDGWIWELAYDGTSWSPQPAGQWKPLGGKYVSGPVVDVTGDNLNVTVYGSDGRAYRATTSDGVAWSGFVDQST